MAEMSYFDKMARDASIRARVLSEGRPDDEQRVVVDPARRRDVESFAARLRGYEPPTDQDRSDYARLDASAMLVNLSKGDDKVLAELQTAILNQDMNSLAETMDKNRIGSKADRDNLRLFINKQDREGIAASLRIISRDILASTRGDSEQLGFGQVDVGLEVANRTRPLMNVRRTVDTTFLKGTNVHYPQPFRKPPHAEVYPTNYSAIEFGEAVDDWERDAQFQPMILDCANASNDMMMEAAGMGKFDGRLDGKGNPWADQGIPRDAEGNYVFN